MTQQTLKQPSGNTNTHAHARTHAHTHCFYYVDEFFMCKII